MSAGVLAALLIAGLALGALLLPMLRRPTRSVLSRAASAEAVLRDKLAQLRLDQAHGLIGPDEAALAEAEVGRALLAAAREARAEPEEGTPGHRAAFVVAAGAAFAASVAVYAVNGSMAHLGGAGATAVATATEGAPTLLGQHEGSVVSDAIVSLRARLQADPTNAENWHLLARSLSTVGDYPGAAEAYARLVELVPLEVELRGDLGEALVRAQDGFVGPAAVAAFDVILAHAPDDPRALYYIALRDAQAGESMKAAQGWARILRTAPADAPFRPAITQILDAIVEDAGLDRNALDLPAAAAARTSGVDASSAPGPTAEQVSAAADLAPDEQVAMIRGMVARLEERLSTEPGDVEGWLRLIRSRLVLGEAAAAAQSLEQALAANPDNPDLVAAREAVAAGARP